MPNCRAVLMAGVILMILIAAIGSSCGSRLAEQTQIGAFIGLSSNIAIYGESQKKGIDLAAEETNSSNYLGKGKTLKVVYADTGASTEGALAAIQSLAAQKVSGLIGPTLSSQAFAADPAAQKSQISVIGISNTVPNIVEMGDFIFRCSLPESEVISGSLKLAADKYVTKKVGVLWGGDQDLTAAGHLAFIAAAEKYNIEIVGDQSYKTGETDFKSALSRIISANPEAICVAALAGDAVQIVVQMRSLGYKGLIIGNNGFNSPDLIKQAGAAAEGIIVGTAWNKDSTLAQNTDFIKSFEKKYGSKPDQFAAQSYTAVKLYASAIKSAGNSDSKAIRDSLAKIRNLATPLGDFSFTNQREPVSQAAVQIVQKGEFVIIN